MELLERINNAKNILETVIGNIWNDDNSMVKVVYEDKTIYVHFALKSKNGFISIPKEKIFFLSNVLRTCMFENDCSFVQGTFTVILNQGVEETEESVKKFESTVALLRNYWSLIY